MPTDSSPPNPISRGPGPRLPRNEADILWAFLEISNAEPEVFTTFIEAWNRMRCLTVWWGLEHPNRVQFRDLDDRIHTLLAYKFLGVIWFDELPLTDSIRFQLHVSRTIPADVTPQLVLKTFEFGNAALFIGCQDMSRPAWLDTDKTIRIEVSMNSLPKEAV